MTAIEYLIRVRDIARVPLDSKEKGGKGKPCVPASNSEMKRWFDKGSIEINGSFPKPFDEIGNEITSLVLFSKSDNRITLVKADGLYIDKTDKLTEEYNRQMLVKQ